MPELIEWDIVTTSDKCPYLLPVSDFEKVVGRECDEPYNPSRYCHKKNCCIKKEKERKNGNV